MRVEKEITIDNIKITLFSWNNKFLLKFEQSGFEQTYKFSELDYTATEIEEFLTDDFINSVKEIFHSMNRNMLSAINK